MKTNIVHITYDEFKKSGFVFPQPDAFRINEKTEFVITECTEEEALEIKAIMNGSFENFENN